MKPTRKDDNKPDMCHVTIWVNRKTVEEWQSRPELRRKLSPMIRQFMDTYLEADGHDVASLNRQIEDFDKVIRDIKQQKQIFVDTRDSKIEEVRQTSQQLLQEDEVESLIEEMYIKYRELYRRRKRQFDQAAMTTADINSKMRNWIVPGILGEFRKVDRSITFEALLKKLQE